MQSWEIELHGACRATGHDADPSPQTRSLTIPCPVCSIHPIPLDLAEGHVHCPECGFTATGPSWEITAAMTRARTQARALKTNTSPAPIPALSNPTAPGTPSTAAASKSAPPGLILPPIIWGGDIHGKKIHLPEELISGMLHRGAKMVLGGGSKSFKTWCLADLAISIASGRPWWGRKVLQGRVLYLNLEVQAEFFETRLQDIARHKGCPVPADLGVWNLRGHCADHTELLPLLADRLTGQNLAAIILDPTYKVMARSENAQEEVAALMNSIERLAFTTGAAVIFGSHFAKGNAAGKEAIDRISGSGVFARDPDAILTMTRHEEDEAFVIDPILRNCPPVDPFCVRWQWPLMRPDPGLDPKDLRQPAAPGRKKKEITTDNVLQTLRGMGGSARGEHRTPGSLAQQLVTEFDCGRDTAKAAIETAVQAGQILKTTATDTRPWARVYKLKNQ